MPIISIETITLVGESTTSDYDVELTDVRVYNRHLTQELFDPDDRENPRIEFLEYDTRYESIPFGGDSAHYIYHPHRWPEGTQNVEITGIFGYTDPDGSETGKTPDLISWANALMVLRQLHSPYTDPDKREDARNRWKVKRLKTRDQEIEYGDISKMGSRGVGVFTGDPEIDSILAAYSRPMRLGAV